MSRNINNIFLYKLVQWNVTFFTVFLILFSKLNRRKTTFKQNTMDVRLFLCERQSFFRELSYFWPFMYLLFENLKNLMKLECVNISFCCHHRIKKPYMHWIGSSARLYNNRRNVTGYAVTLSHAINLLQQVYWGHCHAIEMTPS